VACLKAAEDEQRRRHKLAADWRSTHSSMSPAQACPHHLRFTLLFALSGSNFFFDVLPGLGVHDDPPSARAVRDILLDIYSSISDKLRAQVWRLQTRYSGLRFFHFITYLCTERHGSGSYGSFVLRFVDPDTFSAADLYLGVAHIVGRHHSTNMKSWTQRFLL